MLHTQIATRPQLRPHAKQIYIDQVTDLNRVWLLTENDRVEVLGFLSVRPVHTVVMTGFITDNGMESELNRGKFYGYRNTAGTLEGVALIGHSTLFEARTDDAIDVLANVARSSETPIHLIMSSGNAADKFWNAYSNGFSEPRLRCEESLFETSFPLSVQRSEWDLKVADESQLTEVAKAQAEVAFIECGVDPLARDGDAFLKRVLRRIEQGRVFTVFQDEKLVFKADIIAETDDVIYLEGVYVAPEFRGKGIGPKCLSMLTIELLGRAANICMLSNVGFHDAHRSFEKAGYKATDKCVTLFV